MINTLRTLGMRAMTESAEVIALWLDGWGDICTHRGLLV